MSFRIDKTNESYIFGVSHSKAYNDKDKHIVISNLYHNNGKASSYVKNVLKKVWW